MGSFVLRHYRFCYISQHGAYTIKEFIQVKITDLQVLHVADLARIKLDTPEVAKFQRELNSILEYMDMLSEVDTTGIDPLQRTLPISNAFRPDESRNSQDITDVLKNAPQHEDGYIVVPKVLE